MSDRQALQHRVRYHAKWVLPVTAPAIENGTVLVEGDKIVWVGPRDHAPLARDEELGDAILLPGLVNTHTHLDLTVMRGLLEGLSFFQWIRTLTAARTDVLNSTTLLDSARLGVIEGLHHGITTYADTAPDPAGFDAMRELGVRGIFYHETFGPDPEQCDRAVDNLRRTMRALRSNVTPLVTLGVSPHAPYSVSDALFTAVAKLAAELKLPIATHVAESEEEQSLVVDGDGAFASFLIGRSIGVQPRGRSPIAMLERCGVLSSQTLLIHTVRADATDIATIAEHGCGVAHCPASNAKLGHGIAPLAAMLAAGVHVGLGTDSMASNNRMDLIGEGRLAILAQRAAAQRDDLLEARAAVELATLGGAKALGLGGRVGSLEPGKQADLAAFPIPLGANPVYSPYDALIWAMAGTAASRVVVAGRERLRDGRVVGCDAAAILGKVNATAARLAAWRAQR
jgi:cytosine/adenosine deaminase-related metal-dependent hydrolase